jgi:hypothetical protein
VVAILSIFDVMVILLSFVREHSLQVEGGLPESHGRAGESPSK